MNKPCKCEFVREEITGLKILVAYIVVTGAPHGCDLARDKRAGYLDRFVQTYQTNPPGVAHDLLAVCNGGEPSSAVRAKLASIGAKFYVRPNDGGKDISAYQEVAEKFGDHYDFLVCLGESVFAHYPGWLARWAEARAQLGPGMYGLYGTNTVRTHLQTTAFGIDPKYLRAYSKVTDNAGRMEFEHGHGALWRRVVISGGRAWLVTWDGVYEPREWRVAPNIIWRGDQTNCLLFCNHTTPYAEGDALLKFTFARNADSAFK